MATTITVICPQCKNRMRASAQHVGRQGRCPACQALVSIRAADSESLVSLEQDPASLTGLRERTRSSPTDVNPWQAAALGATATLLLYLVFFWLDREPRRYWLGQFMCERGPVQYAITFVTCWGLSLLGLKLLAVRRQLVDPGRELELIPLTIGLQITPGNVDEFVNNLNELPAEQQQGILLRRIRGALDHFKYRNSVPEVQSYLSTQASIDASAVDSGYTLLRAFIWVCPILGFVGTVWGISAAIGDLRVSVDPAAASAGGAEAFDLLMRQGMKSVTENLATAFDTTLLGLLCVIMLLFPTEILRKVEYATLDRIELYANESLLRRMSEGGPSLDRDPAGYAREALKSAFEQHQHWLAQWQERVSRLGRDVGDQFGQAIQDVSQRLARDEAARLDRIGRSAQVLEQILERATAATSQAAGVGERAAESAQGAARAFADLQERLSGYARLLGQILEHHERLAQQHSGQDVLVAVESLRHDLLSATGRPAGDGPVSTIHPAGSPVPPPDSSRRTARMFGLWPR